MAEKNKETEYFEQNFDAKLLSDIRKEAETKRRSVTQQINIIVEMGWVEYKKQGGI